MSGYKEMNTEILMFLNIAVQGTFIKNLQVKEIRISKYAENEWNWPYKNKKYPV